MSTKRRDNTTLPIDPAGEQAGLGLMTEHQVMALTTYGRGKLRELVAAGEFPAPIAIGAIRRCGTPSRIAWVRAEVLEHLQNLIQRTRVTWAPGQVRNADAQPVQSGGGA